MPVDILVVWGSPAAFAAKRATTTIPILIGAAGDVVNTGLISNLARPDANLTVFIAAKRGFGKQTRGIAQGGRSAPVARRCTDKPRQSFEPRQLGHRTSSC